MKEVFFTLLALSIPLVVLAGLLYMFGHGLFTVIGDWFERRQLRHLRQEWRLRQQLNGRNPPTAADPQSDPSSSDHSPADAPSATAEPVDRETTEA